MTDPIYEIKFVCRVCKGSLDTVLKLGDHYLPGWPLPDEPDPPKAPLELTQCRKCGLVQLRHTVSRDLLYRDYWYESGVNATMRMHLKGIVDAVSMRIDLNSGDVVLDIGANDGTLLSHYPYTCKRIGFEPSRMARKVQEANHVFRSYFTASEYFSAGFPKAKVITAIAMFYDLDDPNTFLQDVKKVLHPDGLFVLEVNTLDALLDGALDIIGHEHLTYWDMAALSDALNRNGLKIFDFSSSPINGGTARVYITHEENETRDSVHILWVRHPANYAKGFVDRIQKLKIATVGILEGFVEVSDKTIYVLGASTRGHTLLQYYGLDSGLITKATDRNPRKHGRRIAGTGIPIISNEQMREEKPDYVLVLPWSFRDEILERERELLEQGTKFIFPLPKLEIVDRETPLALTKER